MITELIASTKPATVSGVEYFIVTTTSGAVVWVRKDQHDRNADQVSYNARKAGEEYTKPDGSVGKLQKDRNEYVGSGKINKFQLLDYMLKIGIQPSLS